MIRIKNWSVFSMNDNGFTAPELISFHLQGDVYGHPRFDDGVPISTSRITDLKDCGDHKEAITKSGSVYCLYPEDVDPMAEKQFPNYYERLRIKNKNTELVKEEG